MSRKTTKTLAATALAALGLSNLSPAQWVAAGAVLSTATVATPALAQSTVPGVGQIVKKKPGNSPIVAPADANGTIRLAGLEPGDYEVSLIGGSRPAIVKVGRDGVLATQAWASDDGKDRWVEDMAGKPVRSETFDLRALFGSDPLVVPRSLPGRPPALPLPPRARFIDVNTSSAADIVRLAPTTSAEAAAFIVAERLKGGAFKDVIDFAQRVCPSVSIDFDLAPTRIGNALIIARGSDPKNPGFKCVRARAGAAPVLTLYNVQYKYVGHVTLLR